LFLALGLGVAEAGFKLAALAAEVRLRAAAPSGDDPAEDSTGKAEECGGLSCGMRDFEGEDRAADPFHEPAAAGGVAVGRRRGLRRRSSVAGCCGEVLVAGGARRCLAVNGWVGGRWFALLPPLRGGER